MCLLVVTSPAQAQVPPESEGVYYPLDRAVPPGVAGEWAGMLGKATPGYFQPVQTVLPSTGQVTVFGPGGQGADLFAPANAGFAVGYTYRLKISDMPEFPGIELYPSIELLDRLHPPEGKANDFPIPLQFSEADIRNALAGRLVTRVIYLEQPQLASPLPQSTPMRVQAISSKQNIFAEADRLGRPMLIMRLGGRLPSARGYDPAFFGSGAPVSVNSTISQNVGSVDR